MLDENNSSSYVRCIWKQGEPNMDSLAS
ncbi:unnamed protein product, partial [Fusarium fujikuroi]